VFLVIFTPAASAELLSAQDWYEAQVSGLGRRFRQAVDVLVERISASPAQFPTVFKNVRRARVQTFPYSLFFAVEGETLFVVACFHASRKPLRWQERT
jgi:plasmid stabilization system protein ParE